jgi:ribosomal protein S7
MKIQQKQFYHKDFYRTIDGCYDSYWTGKLTNSFITKGLKQTVEKELNKVYIYTKLHLNTLALETLLEKIEKIKPTFKLKSVIIAGKKREFPVFLEPEKQRSRAIRNFRDLVSKRKEWHLSQRIMNELIDLQEITNHELLKQRDESLYNAMKNRFNMRFAY